MKKILFLMLFGAATILGIKAAFGYVFKDIAWKTKPIWYIVATEDHSIQPDLERFMGKRTGGKVTEIKSSHVVFISHPKEVTDVIEAAAKGSVKK